MQGTFASATIGCLQLEVTEQYLHNGLPTYNIYSTMDVYIYAYCSCIMVIYVIFWLYDVYMYIPGYSGYIQMQVY